MNTIQTTQDSATPVEPSSLKEGEIKKSLLGSFWSKLPAGLKSKLNNFYSNKKVFIPVVGAFGLIFLVIVLGLLFGNKRTIRNIAVIENTPQAQATPIKNPTDALSLIQINLAKLKDQILAQDVKQSRLQPPPINFDIKF